jgi:hypothetical protein
MRTGLSSGRLTVRTGCAATFRVSLRVTVHAVHWDVIRNEEHLRKRPAPG